MTVPTTTRQDRENESIPGYLKLFFTLVVLLELSTCSVKPPMNVLILYLDDLGYGDIASNRPTGGPAPLPSTPVLDSFKLQSLNFSRHYADSTCSPSRAALLSGRYPSRFGFSPDGRGLAPEITTLAEAFKHNNYKTHFLGKWHTGHTTELAYPDQQGFDTWSGFLNQWMLQSRFDPNQNNLQQPTYINPWFTNQDGEFEQLEGHLTDLISDRAINFIEEQKSSNEPWFMQVSYFAPHEPVQAGASYAANYSDNETGAYLALLDQLDTNIGRILSALKNSGVSENTLVVIVSDNGGTEQRYPSNAPYFGVKTTYTEGGTRTPLMIRWPDGSYASQDYPYAVSLIDLYPTLLSATGNSLPADRLDGIDLIPFIKSSETLVRPLFWEAEADDFFYSTLDSSHRFRYSDNLFGSNVLLDLEQDPTGSVASIVDNEPVRERLRDDYFDWREEIHRVETNFQASDDNGAGTLTGDSFQRSPGFGKFSFGIGVTHDSINDEGTNGQTSQIIAFQKDLLSVSLERGELRVVIQDEELRAPFPDDRLCHNIVITADFQSRISWLQINETMESTIELFIDDTMVASAIDNREIPKKADLTSPTYIGSRGPTFDDEKFQGRLTEPVIYNYRVRAEPTGNQASVSRLSEMLCSQ